MKLKNITFYNKIRHNVPAGCIVLCMGMLACSSSVFAQNDETDEAGAVLKKPEVQKKHYALRTVAGRVLDASNKPVFGAMVKAMCSKPRCSPQAATSTCL